MLYKFRTKEHEQLLDEVGGPRRRLPWRLASVRWRRKFLFTPRCSVLPLPPCCPLQCGIHACKQAFCGGARQVASRMVPLQAAWRVAPPLLPLTRGRTLVLLCHPHLQPR